MAMALINEGLFLCQLTADKSGADVMKLPLHNINLHCAWPLPELYIFLSLVDGLTLFSSFTM